MSALKYNPQDVEEDGNDHSGLVKGKYTFKVEEFGETSFRSGNEGAKAKLLVSFNDRDVPCYVNFVYTSTALWKLREFFDAIDIDFEKPPTPGDVMGCFGMAEFVVNERGYFEAKKFLGDKKSRTKAKGATPEAPADDNVPF
jgi:hypothetical protein